MMIIIGTKHFSSLPFVNPFPFISSYFSSPFFPDIPVLSLSLNLILFTLKFAKTEVYTTYLLVIVEMSKCILHQCINATT